MNQKIKGMMEWLEAVLIAIAVRPAVSRPDRGGGRKLYESHPAEWGKTDDFLLVLFHRPGRCGDYPP